MKIKIPVMISYCVGSGGDSGNQTVLTIIGSVFGFVGIIICFGAIYYYARKKCKGEECCNDTFNV